MSPRRHLPLAVLAAVAVVASPAAAATTTCRDPNPGQNWRSAAAPDLGINRAKLDSALAWTAARMTASVAVYRHGCLAGESRMDPLTSRIAFDGWSMTKSVTSMLAGRAFTLGKLSLDQPIGSLLPETDAAHGAITVRQLLTMTSGLHRNWLRELVPQPDRVADALSLPFDHPPGTWWEYAQSPVTLLGEVVQRAVHEDLQEFAQAELFGPLGIPRTAWYWQRDGTDHTEGWAHLSMRPGAWARLGELMLRKGSWNGRQLLSRRYLKQAKQPIAANPAYGLLFWLNRGQSYRLPAVYGPDAGSGPLVPSAPRDMFGLVGLGEQRVWVIPSRDMVIVRLGDRGSLEPDTRVTVFTGRAGRLDYELVRRVMLAVEDVPYADPGPYTESKLVLPPLDTGILGDARNLDDVITGLLGPPKRRAPR
jgi:CubicO group peptidase (beta-lactamase class C family)